DLVLSLDWVDLGGALRGGASAFKIIQVSLDQNLHNGWSMDYQALPPVDLFLAADPDAVVPALLAALGADAKPRYTPSPRPAEGKHLADAAPTNEPLAYALRQAGGERPTTPPHLPLSWDAEWWPFRHPLDQVGGDGGGGVGGGPGISVGAALALKGSDRLPIGICGDGDFMMGVTALWTAAHYRIPLLIVVCNNRSFFNDELPPERV